MPVPCLAYSTIISDRKVYYLASLGLFFPQLCCRPSPCCPPLYKITCFYFPYHSCPTASCSSQSYLPLLLPFNHHLPLSIGLMLGGVAAVAVLASVRRAGALPATEHHSGSQSHTIGFISNLSADAFCGR